MSLDTAITQQTRAALAGRKAAAGPNGRNATVITAIESHHAELAARLDALTDAALDGMHEILGPAPAEHAADEHAGGGCACGCDCADGADDPQDATLQITGRPEPAHR